MATLTDLSAHQKLAIMREFLIADAALVGGVDPAALPELFRLAVQKAIRSGHTIVTLIEFARSHDSISPPG